MAKDFNDEFLNGLWIKPNKHGKWHGMSVLFLYFLSYGKKTDYNFVLTNHCLYCTVYSSCIAGTVLVYDTRQPDAEPTTLPFPDGDKRPVIGNYFVEVLYLKR